MVFDRRLYIGCGEILAIGERVRPTLLPGATSDHRDLYDENGLPR